MIFKSIALKILVVLITEFPRCPLKFCIRGESLPHHPSASPETAVSQALWGRTAVFMRGPVLLLGEVG